MFESMTQKTVYFVTSMKICLLLTLITSKMDAAVCFPQLKTNWKIKILLICNQQILLIFISFEIVDLPQT